jgi:hypothetical protein
MRWAFILPLTAQVIAALQDDISAKRVVFMGTARAYAARCIGAACSAAWGLAPSLMLAATVIAVAVLL